VQIDVYVTDAEGRLVSGLTADDFELVEDGKPQPITTFEAVDIPIERAEPIDSALAEPDVLTNETPPGRVYLFALDEVEGANILRTRGFVRHFIEEHFGPNDIGAVALLGRGLATSGQDFTRNRRLLLNAVDTYSGGFGGFDAASCSGPARSNDPKGGSRSTQVDSLRSLAEMMARIPGRHKAMLVFTECLDFDALDLVDYNGGVLTIRGEESHAAMAAATRSNLAIYPIHPGGVAADVSLGTLGAFRALGDITGGFAVINSNSFTDAFERIVRDNSTYYMLAFNSAYLKDDGKYVRVQVRVKRPGLTARTRAGYVAPTRLQRQAEALARSKEPAAATTAVATALASPLATRGVPIRVLAAPFKGRDKNATVAMAMEVDASALRLEEDLGVYRGQVDVRYLATDAKRNVYPEVAREALVEVRRDSPGRVPLDRIRVRVVSDLNLPPGRYQVRVAAGADVVAGNVVYDLEVPDFAGAPLSMSGLMLALPSEPTVLSLTSKAGYINQPVKCYSEQCKTPKPKATAEPDEQPIRSLTEALLREGTAGSPTTTREFTAGDQVVLVGEVYDNVRRKPKDPPAVIALKAELRGTGQVVPLASEESPATPLREGISGQAFKLGLTMPAVPPGAYTLRVQAVVNGDAAHAVSREILIRMN
jgi:VWFA-related protein